VLDVIVFVGASGPNVFHGNILDTVYSISSNAGDVTCGFYFAVDNPDTKEFIEETFRMNTAYYSGRNISLLSVEVSSDIWAKQFNRFMEQYKDEAKYLLISHDDLIVKTENFISKTIDIVEQSIEPIGWISYTNDRYYKYDNSVVANSFKDPFAIDRWDDPRLYECHKFRPGQKPIEALFPEIMGAFGPDPSPIITDNFYLLDYPTGPVKSHAPYSHFNFVSMESMKKIGPAAEWIPWTILLDNDWGLEALKNNLNNVWISDVFYTHPNPRKITFHNQQVCKNERVPGSCLRDEREAHEKFTKKWGFKLPIGVQLPDEYIREVRKLFTGTKIMESADKKTYEWDYLKLKA
jgi:hypothetical protein